MEIIQQIFTKLDQLSIILYIGEIIMRIFISLLVIGAMSFILGCQNLESAPKPVTQSNEAPVNSPAPVDNHSEDEHDVSRISLAEAKESYDKGDVFIVDARSADSYASGHIDGAVNIPLNETKKRLSEFPKDKKIIVYCS